MRMMGLKEDYNGVRIRRACTAEGINFAELYSLRKDHKPIREGEEALGPKSSVWLSGLWSKEGLLPAVPDPTATGSGECITL